MKEVYCAACGKKLSVVKKAVPGYGRIITIVDSHECGEVQELDLTPIEIPMVDEKNEKNKFIKGFSDLSKKVDRRPPEHTKPQNKEPVVSSTAPLSLADQIGSLQHTTPEHDLDEDI